MCDSQLTDDSESNTSEDNEKNIKYINGIVAGSYSDIILYK